MTKKCFILLISILLILTFLACDKKEVIDKSELQVRHGVYYKVNEDKGFTGTVITKYENGELQSEGNYKNGKLQFEINYRNKQLDGLAKNCCKNLQLQY